MERPPRSTSAESSSAECARFLNHCVKIATKISLFRAVEFGLGRLTFRRSIALIENRSMPLAAGACSAWRGIDRQGLVFSNRPSRRKAIQGIVIEWKIPGGRRGANRGEHWRRDESIQARRRSKPLDDGGLSRVFFDASRGF
jgi:hypothetical protein